MSVTRGSRKTRIVCISDTHNQTPKLPQGDVLIHAGDLTNQGSYSELKKAVEWLEQQDFEAKIVIAGNHEITLDEPFFRQNQGSWKWPCEQDPGACRRLLVESKSITYLENTTTTVRLGAKGGPRTEFSVFGSPCTPKQGNWAFQYEADEAEHVWDKIPQGVDIVVTHTPPKGHCDGTGTDWQDGRGGCAALQRRLSKIRPKLSVCGHIHGGRGVETVRWRTGARDQATEGDSGRLVESVEFWNDPGRANKKLSVVDLTTGSRAGRRLGSSASLPRQGRPDSGQEHVGRAGVVAGAPDSTCQQPRSGDGQRIGVGTLSLTACALDPDVGNSEALWGRGGGEEETWSHAQGRHVEPSGRAAGMETTTVVNAAYLGGRRAGKAHGQHKPVVVDLDMDTAGGLW